MSNAASLRRLREAAVLDGFCGTCRLRRPREGIKTCDVCLGQEKKRRGASRALGHCRCGQVLTDPRFRQCEGCRVSRRRRGRVREQALIVRGRCLRHPHTLVSPGHVYCELCLEERAAVARKRTRDRRGAALRVRGCSICGLVDHNVLRHGRVPGVVLPHVKDSPLHEEQNPVTRVGRLEANNE